MTPDTWPVLLRPAVLPDKYVVMNRNFTVHSRHTTLIEAIDAMGKFNEEGMFLKVEAWRV